MLLNCDAEKTLTSPLDCKEIQPVHPKRNQSWIFTGRTDAEAETPILWPPDVKNWLIWKDPDAGKDWRQEEKGTTENEMVEWYHRLNWHEFESDGQGSLACCSPWGSKESDMTEWLNLTQRFYRERRCCYGFQWGQHDRCGLSKWSSPNSRQCGRLAPGCLPLWRRQEWLPEEPDSQFGALCCKSVAGQKSEWHWPNGTSAWGLAVKTQRTPVLSSILPKTASNPRPSQDLPWWRLGFDSDGTSLPGQASSLCWVHSWHPSLASMQASASVVFCSVKCCTQILSFRRGWSLLLSWGII